MPDAAQKLFAQGRLAVRPPDSPPGSPVFHSPVAAGGVLRLGLAQGRRDGALFVPSSYHPGRAAPLVLTLHGAGGSADGGIYHLREEAERHGALLLSPESRGTTWDFLRGGLGPDVAYIDAALQHTLERYNVDSGAIAASGFSDGASYALTLGLANGDLFTHVLAFSPGFMRPPRLVGRPRVYVSHGVFDAVLSISGCSRRLVPRLKADGYHVRYSEFQGPHTVPDHVTREAFDWWLEGRQHEP